jgi:hypothetical protein
LDAWATPGGIKTMAIISAWTAARRGVQSGNGRDPLLGPNDDAPP